MQLKWRKDLETGDAIIDGQHKELLQKIQDIITACKEGREKDEVASLLTFLKQYVQRHFSAEIQYQTRHNYPQVKEHVEQHEILVSRLATLEQEYSLQGSSLPVVTNSLKLTYEWLTWHLLDWDKKISAAVDNKQS